MRQHGSEFARFATVAVIGLVVDIAVAWVLWTLLGINLIIAAGLGFFAGACVNYLLHEFWTFKRAGSEVSARRITRYGAALVVTLAVRLGTVYLLSLILGAETYALFILIASTGVSFVANYVVSKVYVFQPDAAPARKE